VVWEGRSREASPYPDQLSLEELRGREVALKKVGKRAAALMEQRV
jgi:hypothetical protein